MSTGPRRVDLHEVFCVVLYLLKSGCQGRMLPKDFPQWRTVHSYCSIWSEPHDGGSLLKQALKNRGGESPIKSTDMAGLKGYDADKKTSGIKRHIAVDTQGLPMQ